MRRHPEGRLGAAELAWSLLALLSVGLRAREAGWCLGELRAADVELTRLGVARVARPGRVRAVHRWRRWRHSRRGHDEGCLRLGVPQATARRLLRGWGSPAATPFISGLVDEALAELARHGSAPPPGSDPAFSPLHGAQPRPRYSRGAAKETVEHLVRQRITPRAPEFHGARGAVDYGPSSRDEEPRRRLRYPAWLRRALPRGDS